MEVSLFLVNCRKEATTRTAKGPAGGGGGGEVVALVFDKKLIWVGGHSKWLIETRAATGQPDP